MNRQMEEGSRQYPIGTKGGPHSAARAWRWKCLKQLYRTILTREGHSLTPHESKAAAPMHFTAFEMEKEGTGTVRHILPASQ
jgi:hypothetical protein